MISFKHVTKTYGEKITALKDVSFEIEEGEFVFLTGPSGSGKSTIVKLLTAEEKANIGVVIANNISAGTLTKKNTTLYRRNLGVVFQDFRLIDNKTVWENIYCIMRGIGLTPMEAERRIPELLVKVGIADRKDSYPHQLSGGEQQRVAIARALASNPKIIIADEPTGNLDPEMSEEIMKLLLKINEEGATILVVTHERDLVNNLCKRVIRINKGNLLKDELEGTYA